MDVVTLVLARKQAIARSKEYTDLKISELIPGFNYKGAVATIADLPTTGNVQGDCYNVLDGSGVYVWSVKEGVGSWGSASKVGPQGPVGPAAGIAAATASIDAGTGTPSVTVTTTGPDTAKQFDFEFHNLKGQSGSQVSVSATGTSTNDVRYITINGAESRFASVALRAMKSEWKGAIATSAAAQAILNDESVIEGDGFLGTVYWTDLPIPGTGRQAEVKAFVLKKQGYTKIIQFECTSGTTPPYAWFYNSYEGQWRSYVPLNDTVTSTSTNAALTANMGKSLQDQITNLQNIGRFLAIWNATIGKPTTEPTSTLPYTYRTGDYYRVGVVGGGRHIHQLTMMGTTTESTGYTASFGFIDETSSSYTSFTNIAQKLYALGHRTTIDGLECTYTIGSTTRSSNGFVYSPNANGDTLVFEYYEGQSYYEEGRATTVNTATDSVSAAYAHDINIEGTSSSSPAAQVYIDHLAFPSTANTAYTSVADIAQVLQRLHYSEDFPCFCGGQVGSTSIYLCYGSGNELVLMNNIRSEVGRIATSSTINDTVTSTGVTNYKPDGTTYTGRASTVVETEELEVGAVYYFDGSKWVLQKSGGGGKVQDVQINGTTIVASGTGIANIPIAGNSTLGAVSCASGNDGININTTTGKISIAAASTGNIENKTEAFRPLVPSTLDKAVMEGLGNNSLTWTDAYKASARTTIGAGTPIQIEFLGEND